MQRTNLFIVTLTLSSLSFAQGQNSAHWWGNSNERSLNQPLNSPGAKAMPLISVRANRFVDPQGNPVLFRGVSIGDPDKLQGQGHWNRETFEHVRAYGANIVRIPVHPVAWRERGPVEYLHLLDQAVEWCTDLRLYIDLDWHSIGNLETELFQDPMYNTSKTETFAFWRTAAVHFGANNTVALFELFNEPTTADGRLGPVSWADWKRTMEDLTRVVRGANPQIVPLIAGFDWAYYLTELREAPISADNVGYVTHPYPNKKIQPWEPKWEEDFGFASARYPVIATEIGYTDPTENRGSPYNYSDYGPAIVNYLEGRGISWIAWAYDPNWGPQLLKSWNFDLTKAGEFFKQQMSAPVSTGESRPGQ